MNTLELQSERGYSAVLDLMFQDGFGPDEVEAHLKEYAVELTGKATPTALLLIKRHARRTIQQPVRTP